MYSGKRTQNYSKDDKETLCSYLKFKWLQRDSNPQPLCKRKLTHLAKLAKWLNG